MARWPREPSDCCTIASLPCGKRDVVMHEITIRPEIRIDGKCAIGQESGTTPSTEDWFNWPPHVGRCNGCRVPVPARSCQRDRECGAGSSLEAIGSSFVGAC